MGDENLRGNLIGLALSVKEIDRRQIDDCYSLMGFLIFYFVFFFLVFFYVTLVFLVSIFLVFLHLASLSLLCGAFHKSMTRKR